VFWSDTKHSKDEFNDIMDEVSNEAVERLLNGDKVLGDWIGSESICELPRPKGRGFLSQIR
jgi:hypothetical protein